MTVTLEIVCVGNELLIGKVVNTNASWMGKRATSLGVDVRRITTCRDEIPEIVAVVRECLSRKPDFIVTSGGLGPTFDDMTLEGLAKALNRKTVVDAAALEMVKAKIAEYARRRNVPVGEMTPPRMKMATIPECTAAVKNPIGTAPGVRADVDGTVLFALPGVPRECEAIFEESIVPLLKEAAGDLCFCEASVYADNIMESFLAPLIDRVMQDNPRVYIKSHPQGGENQPHLELHISTSGKPEEKPEAQVQKAASELAALVGQAGGKTRKA